MMAREFFFTTLKLQQIFQTVKIELGARSDHWPVSIQEISPYIVEIMPDELSNMKAQIRVLNIERTFWEKATILRQKKKR